LFKTPKNVSLEIVAYLRAGAPSTKGF